MTTPPVPVVVVALDAFKGSLSADDAARAVGAGVLAALPRATVRLRPMADGGEGTLDALVAAWSAAGRPASVRTVATTDALGRASTARWALSPDGTTAVVELAEASGLPAVSDRPLRALDASTAGTGVLARAALDAGVEEVLVCLGGSATTDGGAGLLTGLGVRFLDASGAPVRPGGAGLVDLASVDDAALHPRARSVRWRVAVDVTNPLTGPTGAAAVFGPQKGASPDDVRVLDAGLDRLARVLTPGAGAVDLRTLAGAGAAGGVPAGLVALLGAVLEPGALLVARACGLPEALADADLVVTGEGRLDAQSLDGKVVAAVADLAHAASSGPAVVVLAGQVTLPASALAAAGVDAAFSIADGPADLDRLVADAAGLLTEAAAHVTALWWSGRGGRLGG